MNTRITPTNTPTIPRTIRIQVSEKGKLRLIDADLLPGQGNTPEPHQKAHQLSEGRTFDDGRALLTELSQLVYMRRAQGHAISPDELSPFLIDLEAVLARGWTEASEAAQRLDRASTYLRRWCVRVGNAG
ncbi:MAG: hypothetical protein HQL86_00190 [Magnetococcales bacterium]|nr:hypothetical protein [Magnetococcales bacterium]